MIGPKRTTIAEFDAKVKTHLMKLKPYSRAVRSGKQATDGRVRLVAQSPVHETGLGTLAATKTKALRPSLAAEYAPSWAAINTECAHGAGIDEES
jgi:hypothetical protein